MSDGRRLAALMIAVIGLGSAAFGVVRGLSATGPASGVRMIVSIAPPVDDAAREMAEHVATARVDEKGMATRVVPAGDKLVVELGDDAGNAAEVAALLERTGKLEVHAVDAASPWLARVAGRAATGRHPRGRRRARRRRPRGPVALRRHARGAPPTA